MTGKLFVIEGLDGSGKQTQSSLLYERLKEEGRKVRRVEYPNYQSESSALAKMYLRGDFGEKPEDVSPYISSTFYAVDRYASYKTDYGEFYRSGGIVIADRYATSNMVHQASKLADAGERTKFLDWLWELEFGIYGIPVPTQVFFLDIGPDTAISLMAHRENKFTHESQKDIHEKNARHLKQCYAITQELISRYRWEKISCTKEGILLSVEEIHKEIYHRLLQYL